MKAILNMFCLLTLLFNPMASIGQGLRTSFHIPPQIQVNDWQMLVSEHFVIYYQSEFIETAHEVLGIVNSVTPSIENILGFRLSNRLSIVIFPSAKDLNQSAFFSKELLPIQQNPGGTTEITGNSFAVFHDGNRTSIITQVKKGIADMLIREMLFGGTVHERIKYATLMQVPYWFSSGLSRYIVKPWDARDDDAVRDLVFRKGFLRIGELSPEEQSLVGKSVWNYIAELKGEVSFQRILYLVRLTRKVENAFTFVFNWNSSQLINEWHDYVVGIYLKDQLRKHPRNHEMRPKKNETLLDIGFLHKTMIIRTIRKKNRFRLDVFDHVTRTNELWFKSSFKPLTEDENRFLPLWSADKKGGFWVSDFDKGGFKLHYLQKAGVVERSLELSDISLLLDFDFDATEEKFVLSVISKGKSELWLLTKDGKREILHSGVAGLWDLKFEDNGSSFLSVGDWPNDSMAGKMAGKIWESDIFEWKRQNGKWTANRLTHTPNTKEEQPLYYVPGKISFLSDENGIFNAWSMDLSTNEKIRLTDYKRNILKNEYISDDHQVVEIITINGQRDWYLSPGVDYTPVIEESAQTSGITYNRIRFMDGFAASIVKVDTIVADTQNNVLPKSYFQTDFPFEVDFIETLPDSLSFENKTSTTNTFQIKYVRSFKPDQLILQIDNSFVNTTYVPAMMKLEDALVILPGLNFSLRLRELLGNYNITMGARVARNFNHFDSYVSGRGSLKKKAVHVYLYRQSRIVFPTDGYNKIITNSASLAVYMAQKRFMALQVKGEFRSDNKIVLSTDDETLRRGGLHRIWLSPSINYTFNNTLPYGMNAYNGLKMVHSFQYWQNTAQKGTTFVLASDVRIGVKLRSNLFWMSRFQMEISAGNMKMLYVAGAMENWLKPVIDQNTVLRTNAAFIRMGSSIRGLNMNVRNGNTMAIINSEIRWRILSDLLKINTRMAFINDFMMTGFLDAGSAWYGVSPFDITNPNNVQIINSGQMVITVYNHKQPFVLGSGYGFRTNIFGYYIKFDQGIGLDNGRWGKPIKYITIGLDF
jgi:hypothetical protein